MPKGDAKVRGATREVSWRVGKNLKQNSTVGHGGGWMVDKVAMITWRKRRFHVSDLDTHT